MLCNNMTSAIKYKYDYRKVSYNEIAKAVIESKQPGISKNIITDDDLKVIEFIYKFKFVSDKQIDRFINCSLGIYNRNKVDTLTSAYGVFNRVSFISQENGTSISGYIIDTGGVFCVGEYTNTDISESTEYMYSQKHVYSSLTNLNPQKLTKYYNVVDIYLGILEICKDVSILNRYIVNKLEYKDNIIEKDSKKVNLDKVYEFKLDLLASIKKNNDKELWLIKDIGSNNDYDIENVVSIIENYNIFLEDKSCIVRYELSSNKNLKLILVLEDSARDEMIKYLKFKEINIDNVYIISRSNFDDFIKMHKTKE